MDGKEQIGQSGSQSSNGFDIDAKSLSQQASQQNAQSNAEGSSVTFPAGPNGPSNMSIWDRVKTTDTRFAKATGFGSFKFTAVDPQWQLQEATKLWGPYGQRWGLVDLRFSTFESIEGRSGDTVTVMTMMLEAVFMYPGGRFPIAVDMRFKSGQDIAKKLITSARSKALSFLGFSADVFMGKFDDMAYVNDLKIKEEEFGVFEKKALSSIRTANSIKSLVKMKHRVEDMVARETITGDQGAFLLDEVELRTGQLNEQSEQVS